MSATEELRRLLDERGVKWWPDTYYKDTNTCWRIDGFEWRASERDGKLLIGGTYTKYLTPEGAIAVTVSDERTAIMHTVCDDDGVGHSECGACGRVVGEWFKFCPWCGCGFTTIERTYIP